MLRHNSSKPKETRSEASNKSSTCAEPLGKEQKSDQTRLRIDGRGSGVAKSETGGSNSTQPVPKGRNGKPGHWRLCKVSNEAECAMSTANTGKSGQLMPGIGISRANCPELLRESGKSVAAISGRGNDASTVALPEGGGSKPVHSKDFKSKEDPIEENSSTSNITPRRDMPNEKNASSGQEWLLGSSSKPECVDSNSGMLASVRERLRRTTNKSN